MFGGEDHIFRAGVAECPGPGVGIPFLDLLVKDGRKVVVIVVGAVVLAMVSLGRRPVDSHHVQIPLGVGIVLDVVGCPEIVLGVDQGSPARNRVKAPMNKYPQFCVGIPLRQGMLIERFEGGLVVRRSLRTGRKGKTKHQEENNSTEFAGCGQGLNGSSLHYCWLPWDLFWKQSSTYHKGAGLRQAETE